MSLSFYSPILGSAVTFLCPVLSGTKLLHRYGIKKLRQIFEGFQVLKARIVCGQLDFLHQPRTGCSIGIAVMSGVSLSLCSFGKSVLCLHPFILVLNTFAEFLTQVNTVLNVVGPLPLSNVYANRTPSVSFSGLHHIKLGLLALGWCFVHNYMWTFIISYNEAVYRVVSSACS